MTEEERVESETVEMPLSGQDVLNWPEFEALMNRLDFPMSNRVTGVVIHVEAAGLVEVTVGELAAEKSENAVS